MDDHFYKMGKFMIIYFQSILPSKFAIFIDAVKGIVWIRASDKWAERNNVIVLHNLKKYIIIANATN